MELTYQPTAVSLVASASSTASGMPLNSWTFLAVSYKADQAYAELRSASGSGIGNTEVAKRSCEQSSVVLYALQNGMRVFC